MKRYRKLLVCLILVLTLSFPATVWSAGDPDPPQLDGTQSAWAEAELAEAYRFGLTYPGVMNNFKRNITREEFCVLAVRLYEGLTGKVAPPAPNPFADTANEEVLKAYQLGIVRGVSDTRFAPANPITRQEICAMIYRALDASLPSLNKDTTGDFPFSDQSRIAAWALESMRFAYKNQIMLGIGNSQIGPLQNTTREQAIALLKRTYVNYSGVVPPSLAVGTLSTAPGSSLGFVQRSSYQALAGNSLFFPDYDERLQLKDPSFSTFIDQTVSTKKWFAFSLSNATGVKNVYWQVASAPFAGGLGSWRTPTGLMGSGVAAPASGGFQVDFAALRPLTASTVGSLLPLPSLQPIQPIPIVTPDPVELVLAAKPQPIPQQQRLYYVRAVPVDLLGNPVGEPGQGIAVLYGKRVADAYPAIPAASFQVWTPYSSSGFFTGENQDRPTYKPTITVDPRNKENRLFHFNGIASGSSRLLVQISTEPFPASGAGWENASDLIYEQAYDLPMATLVSGYPNSVYVDFNKFAKPAAEMKEGVYTRYYLRGVALKPSLTPGTFDAMYSSPVTIEYGFAPPLTWFSDSPYKSTQELAASLPDLRIKRYTPVQWPAADYQQHYYVFRSPTAAEIKCNWKNTSTGEILYPYYLNIGYYASKGIDSPQEYETSMIPRVLPVGTKVHFPPPKDEDKAWYQQLFDGIVDFFKDLGAAAKSVVNQVSAAYAKLKADFIQSVVDLCPIDSLKGPFKTALEGAVSAGLMSLGIPPTLPNFDELSEMSMDFMAEVVLTEAGIPPTEWTKDLVEDVANGIAREVERSTRYADANPIDAAFLKLDPAYLYRPAVLEIELANKTGDVSVPGTFDLHVTFEMDHYNKIDPAYGLSLSVPNNYALGSGAGTTVSLAYWNHFEYGLNNKQVNYVQGGKAVYDIFDPLIGIKVPKLLPGETTTMTVYLDPYSGSKLSRYPQGENLLPIDFENMYILNGNKKFTHFTLIGRFPSAEDYLLSNKYLLYLDPEVDYIYSNEGYEHLNEKLQKPVNGKW